MKRHRFGVVGALALLACGGPGAATPQGGHGELPRRFAEAFQIDAVGDPAAATKAYLDVVGKAAGLDGDPWQVPALESSLDALVARRFSALGDAANDAALAWRAGSRDVIAHELDRLDARGPFARGLVAAALRTIDERSGDPKAADKHRAASGCARQAVVIGPISWAPITGIEEPGSLSHADVALPGTLPVGDVFGTVLHPITVEARGCALPLTVESAREGVRDVVVDFDIPRAEDVGFILRTRAPAVLRAGAEILARRTFEMGDGTVARFGRASVGSGVLRVVVRVGSTRDSDTVEIDAFGPDGLPLTGHAPAVGSVATSRVARALAVDIPAFHGDDEALLAASAALADGSPREAEQMLWSFARAPTAAPGIALVYGRAVVASRDLSVATRADRARSAYERVLEAWPTSWEGNIAHATLAGIRRGKDEADVEILRDLDARRTKLAPGPVPPIFDAFEALVAGRERMFDRAQAALDRARISLGGTALFAQAEDSVIPSLGKELVANACDPTRAVPRDTMDCLDALRATGDVVRMSAELGRLRTLLGAPTYGLALELRDALVRGDDATAQHAYGAMLPAERTLAALSAIDRSPGETARLLRVAATASDAPRAIMPLLHAAGEDIGRELDADAERIATQDRALLPNAATAVLAHRERYLLDGSGLLHWSLFDVRRVSGTTDVEENAQASAPDISGRTSARALRRRIFKRDGRILEPDPTPHASQSHADLSQLEQGDVVEAVYEGWALPGDTWDIGIDTPDMLPERTAIHDATIELVLPVGLRWSIWSHPMLGQVAEESGGAKHTFRWHLVDHAERRVEDGVPAMDRSVRVSFSTADWKGVARALRETVASLDEHDPEVAAWAHDSAPSESHPTRATVDAIVTAAGKALRESDAGALSDYAGGVTQTQTTTARSSLASHNGSRSWLIVRALRELGVASELVVSEATPFSADPAFPPHYGRFIHPLVVAHVDGKDVWIDADVEGPPLPAGRISPELRGRYAMAADGTIAPLPSTSDPSVGDEVDVRLALDAHGDARGTFAIVLRGRAAQSLAEQLVKTVGAERQRALRDVVLAWLPWANVDDVQLASTEESWQVSLRADVSVKGYAQLEGAKTWLLPGLDTMHWSSPRARVGSLGAVFAARGGRESALSVSHAVQYHVHRRLELPQGATVARMPGPLVVRAPHVEASRRISVTSGAAAVVEDDFALGVSTGTVPLKDYDGFAAAVHSADDGFLASTRVAVP